MIAGRWAWGCVTLALLSSAACAAPAPQTASKASDRPVIDPSAEARALHLPFDTYKRTETDIALVERAADVLTSQCLTKKGYSRSALPGVTVIEAPNRRRYGVMEPLVAKQAGYRAPLTSAEKERERAGRARGGYRDAAERSAARDCLQDSTDRVYLDGTESPLLTRLEREIFEQARTKDLHVRAALDKWRSCMRARGQKEYADPLAAAADDRWKDPGSANAQTATAVADVACKEETGLVEVWRRTEEKLQTAALKQHPADLDQVRRTLEKERTEAIRVVQSTTS
ncbi:hypothetical protein SAMN05444920_13360 [Nonomuraea solani]|uniref:Uncharacterized protein n=1 Tax=Nonomuraea solani TaxID=1144553 RepID=A0A1H6F1X1_9ACTN|nr:hypothetical protein [Nonomuraea solani]SEH03156.1 hypothetical protein SAMN05444920_13360 [Nonomuraea solani]